MSSRAQLVSGHAGVRRYEWQGLGGGAAEPHLYLVPPPVSPGHGGRQGADATPGAGLQAPSPDQDARLASLEREAFTKGYAAGERAGVEAGARRADAMLRRVAQTIEDLAQLRQAIVRQTEQQMVELAIALARRVVLRELSLDPDLVAALAHVAVERLGQQTPATIRLHPEDYATVAAQRGEQWEGAQVTVLPDPAVQRGGCLVESDFGLIDATVDGQFAELSRALLGEAVATAPESDLVGD
jgi:flagellar assembly protein FliH